MSKVDYAILLFNILILPKQKINSTFAEILITTGKIWFYVKCFHFLAQDALS